MNDDRQQIGRRWQNLDVERERDRGSTRWLWIIGLCLVVSAAPMTFYLAFQNECVTLNYQMDSLRSEEERLLEARRRLNVERAGLESLDRIERVATGEHGMHRPTAEQVVIIPPGRDHTDDLLARSP